MEFQFDPQKYQYASRRKLTYGTKGMVCTAQPLAAQAGLDIIKAGGNAVDAAIATAACLTVVEPTANGIGSDCFALVWMKDENKLFGLNGSGPAPMGISAEALREQGWDLTVVDRQDNAVQVTLTAADGASGDQALLDETMESAGFTAAGDWYIFENSKEETDP